jgi:hypothetical protein
MMHRMAVHGHNLVARLQARLGSGSNGMVVLSASLVGLPTCQTMTANAIASKKLKRGPAKATMILSRGETFGNGSAGISVLPSMASMVAI